MTEEATVSEGPIEWVNELGARRWQPRLNDDRRAWDDDLQGVYIWGRSSVRHPTLFRYKRRAARIARRFERIQASRAWKRTNP